MKGNPESSLLLLVHIVCTITLVTSFRFYCLYMEDCGGTFGGFLLIKLVGVNTIITAGFLTLPTLIWTTQRSLARLSSKTSLTAGKQQPRLKMETYGRCHRGKKIFSSKNSTVELHTANFRCANIITGTYIFIFPSS